MRKALVVLGVIAGVVGGGYGFLNGAGATSRSGATLTVVESVGRVIDEATQQPPDLSQPLPAGDTIAFRNDLLRAGHVVGYDRGACTAVFDTKFECSVSFVLDGEGTLALQVLFDVAQPEGDYAVVGGTGAFAGRRGWGHYVVEANGTETHTIHLMA